MLAKGLKVGEPAPQIAAQDIEGDSITVGGARADSRATLLVFVSPTCPVCKTLLPVLKSSLAAERMRSRVSPPPSSATASQGSRAR